MSDGFDRYTAEWHKQRQREETARLNEKRKTALLDYLRQQNYVVKQDQYGRSFLVYTSKESTELFVEITVYAAEETPTEKLIDWIEQQRKSK